MGEWKYISDTIFNGIKNNQLCGDGVVSANYVKDLLSNIDMLLVIGTPHARKLRSKMPLYGFETVQGFASLIFTKNYLYVAVICAKSGKGAGVRLFAQIHDVAKMLGLKEIRLHALPSAMMRYYKAYGFKFKEGCEIVRNNIKKQKIEEKIEEKVRKLLNTNSTSTNYKRFHRELETLLAKANIVYEKGCETRERCGVNGYSMTKCFS